MKKHIFILPALAFCLAVSANPQELEKTAQSLYQYTSGGISAIHGNLDKIETLLDKGLALSKDLSRTKVTARVDSVTQAPVYTLNGAGIHDVAAQWVEQVRDNVNTVKGILKNDPEIIREWMSQDKDRYGQIVRCFTEAKKALLCLKKGAVNVVNYKKGRVLFADDFSGRKSLDNWIKYGDGTLKIVEGRLQFLDPQPPPDYHIWTRKKFSGDFSIEFDFEPLWPPRGGHIISYCALPKNPKGDLSGSGRGYMENYYNTVTCYHYSFARAGSRVSNLRKTGPGLWMCANSFDPCQNRQKTYHVQVVKIRNNHLLFIDGSLVHHYIDMGVYGDSLYHAGHVGIRNWTGLHAYYDNFTITRLVPENRGARAGIPWDRIKPLPDIAFEKPGPAVNAFYNSGLSMVTGILTRGGLPGGSDLVSPAMLKKGAPIKVLVKNPFSSAQTFYVDWSYQDRGWSVVPETGTVTLAARSDSVLTFTVRYGKGGKAVNPPVCLLKGENNGRTLACVEMVHRAPCLGTAQKITRAPRVDGRLDESFWAGAPLSGELSYPEQPISVKTQAAVAYDEKAVYFGIKCFENGRFDSFKNNQDILKNNIAEVYFSPEGRGYIKVSVTARGESSVRNTLNGKTPASDNHQCAVYIGKDFWSAEIAVPFAMVGVSERPKADDLLRFNFTRQRSVSEYEMEYGTWCGDFNAEWEFGYLVFK